LKILSAPSITALPHLAYDPGWDRNEWEHRTYDASYAVRFLRSRFRRWPVSNEDPRGAELERLNAALISKFIGMAASDGTLPLLVYLPARVDFSAEGPVARAGTLRALERAEVSYTDLRSCIAAVGVDKAFIAGRPHYSPAGNAAVAKCLLPIVREALARD
jgi:hypothetical protein